MSNYQKLAEVILNSNKVIAITGAGMSTESGIPDFRSKDGLWSKIDPVKECSIHSFNNNPERFWTFYHERLANDGSFKPNAAHYALKELEKYNLKGIVTQNIDGLHHQAGSSKIIEIHGTGKTVMCPKCGETKDYQEALEELVNNVPYCQYKHPMKPSIILFGEMLPDTAHTAIDWCYEADLILTIGTSLQVQPVASWALANQENHWNKKDKLAIFNNDKTPLDQYASFTFDDPLSVSLPALIKALEELKYLKEY